jgi:subtilisin
MQQLRDGIQIIREHQPLHSTARASVCFEADSAHVSSVRKTLASDVLLEPAITFRPHGTSLIVRAEADDGRFLPGAALTLLPVDMAKEAEKVTGITGRNGSAVLQFDDALRPFWLIVAPAGGFWSVFADNPSDVVTVRCPALPVAGPLGWWHRAVGIHNYDENRGRGARVGIVDTGVGPHPNLRHVESDQNDVSNHGTHVCGIIAARPRQEEEFAGIAPGATVFAVRVYNPDMTTDQGHIVHAIEKLAEPAELRGHEVDLINLSLGSSQRSSILHDAIKVAFDLGTLCICSAGNTMDATIDFPAAFAESAAVSGLGHDGFGPARSTTSHWVPNRKKQRARFGEKKIYFAGFSAFGPRIFCAGPGNGIISTVPARNGLRAPYAQMDGTSMSSAAVCGTLAVALAESQEYRSLPRNRSRAQKAKAILAESCQDLGLAAEFQGAGIPAVGAVYDRPHLVKAAKGSRS